MENSPPDPPGSSPPEFDPIDIDLLPNLRPSPNRPTQVRFNTLGTGLEPSSDPLNGNSPFNFTPIQSASQSRFRKRTANFANSLIDSQPRTSNLGSDNETTVLILQARDLIVKAYSTTQNRSIQARLLDLLEVFREYTEKGQIQNVSTILATQVANLEQTSRKIELQAKTQALGPKKTQNPVSKTTYTNVASTPDTRPNRSNSVP